MAAESVAAQAPVARALVAESRAPHQGPRDHRLVSHAPGSGARWPSVRARSAGPSFSRPPRRLPVRGLAWLLFLGSSVHVAATGWLYTLPDVRAHVAARPLRYAWIPAGLVVAGAVTAAALSPAAMAWLLLAYFGWQFFHFQKQNLGMAALAASVHRVRPLGRAERRALMGAGGAGILGLLAHPGLLQLRVHPSRGDVHRGGAVVRRRAGFGVVALVRRPAADRPAGFCAMYLMALLFSLPIFAFRSPYAAVGGMTIAHGFQYLLLVGLVAAGNRRGTSRWLRLAVFANVALVGGALLSGASHLHGFPPVIRLVFGAYLGVVMAHFVIDAGFWRMRDPFPRAFMARHVPGLVPSRATAPVAVSRPPQPGCISGRRWIVRRYRVAFMAKKTQPGDEKSPAEPLASFGRYAGPAP